MPRRPVLTATERDELFALPGTDSQLTELFAFGDVDLATIRRHRGDANRVGFAVQLCLLRYPGTGLFPDANPPAHLIRWVGRQLGIDPELWHRYADRDATRRDHHLELRSYLGLRQFRGEELRDTVAAVADVAFRSDKGIVLARSALETLRRQHIIVPAVGVIERICAEAITRANRRIFRTLSRPLSERHRRILDALLSLRPESSVTWLTWLRQPPLKPNSRQMLDHLDRLRVFQAIDLPPGIEQSVHQNRLLKIAREGAQMTPQNLGHFRPDRRYATLVAMVIEGTATVTDEIVDLHDRILGKLFRSAKHRHREGFHKSGKAINEKVRLFSRIGLALVNARETGDDPFAAIESIIPWEAFAESVTEAERLARPESFDFIHLVGDNYKTIRRYAPKMLNVLRLRATPAAQGLVDALDTLRALNADGGRSLPENAPTDFIKRRWQSLVVDGLSLDRRFYEICALAELRNALRSGDVWVQGSRQFKAFGEYLVPDGTYSELRDADSLQLAVATDRDMYLDDRLGLLEVQLATVNRMARDNALPDAVIEPSGLKITPLESAVPDSAQALIDRTAKMLPHVKITELLMEVDEWTGFSGHFTHLKSGEPVMDRIALLTAILADAINLGLSKMAESCPGTTYARLAWLQAWHVRDETYSAALAEIVNAQHRMAFACHWGDGTTSSSDGQRFKAGGKAESTGHVNPKYGSEPGRTFYTHVSDQYAPFSVKLVNVGIRDSTFVLDGLLYHESDLRIEEHYTDTAGFTDHVFALMHLLGFRFAPRIRDLKDTKLFVPEKRHSHSALSALIGGAINIRQIRTHWDEILRLATSIRQGTVTASLILRKLGNYPRQNGLAVALREFGRIERTLFILDWLQNVETRRRVNDGLNKGEARNALARAVFFNRLGEIRDHGFDQQRYRASGLNLATAAIALWNTVYLERAVTSLKANGETIDPDLLRYLSPLGWGHINLTGDYLWRQSRKVATGRFRPLRPVRDP